MLSDCRGGSLKLPLQGGFLAELESSAPTPGQASKERKRPASGARSGGEEQLRSLAAIGLPHHDDVLGCFHGLSGKLLQLTALKPRAHCLALRKGGRMRRSKHSSQARPRCSARGCASAGPFSSAPPGPAEAEGAASTGLAIVKKQRNSEKPTGQRDGRCHNRGASLPGKTSGRKRLSTPPRNNRQGTATAGRGDLIR